MLEKIPLQTAIVTSEDRLFVVLSRPTFEEMRKAYVDFLNDSNQLGSHFNTWTLEKEELFFSARGWTYEEFSLMHEKLNIKIRYV